MGIEIWMIILFIEKNMKHQGLFILCEQAYLQLLIYLMRLDILGSYYV